MDNQEIRSRRMLGVVVAVILFVVAVNAISRVALYADGSYGFCLLLSSKFFTFYDKSRDFAVLIGQLPVMAFLYAGFTSIPVLSSVLTLGVQLPPALFIIGGVYMCHKDKQYSLMLLSVIFYALLSCFSSFLCISESFLAATVFWFLFVYFHGYRQRSRSFPQLLIVGFLTLSTIAIYPSFVFFGGILLFVMSTQLWSLVRSPATRTRADLVFLAFAMCLILLAIGNQFLGIIHPLSPQNKAGFIRSLFSLLRSFVGVTSGTVLLIGLCIAVRHVQNLQTQRIIRILGVLGGVLFIANVLRNTDLLITQSSELRVGNLILPFGFSVLFLIVHRLRVDLSGLRSLVYLFLAGVLLFHGMAAYGYARHLKAYTLTTQQPAGFINVDKEKVFLSPYFSSWPVPFESILAQAIHGKRGGKIETIFVRPRDKVSWEPFDVYVITNYPDLGRYGVVYDETNFQ